MSKEFSVVGPKIYATIRTGIPILGDIKIT